MQKLIKVEESPLGTLQWKIFQVKLPSFVRTLTEYIM